MQKGKRAFETLPLADQKSLIDVNAAIAVLMARLSTMVSPVDVVVEAFAAQTHHSTSHVNYAMQDIWDALLDQDWQFIVTKKGVELVTQFIPTRTGGSGNGDPGQEPQADDHQRGF